MPTRIVPDFAAIFTVPSGTFAKLPYYYEQRRRCRKALSRDDHDESGDAGCTRAFSFVVVAIWTRGFFLSSSRRRCMGCPTILARLRAPGMLSDMKKARALPPGPRVREP